MSVSHRRLGRASIGLIGSSGGLARAACVALERLEPRRLFAVSVLGNGVPLGMLSTFLSSIDDTGASNFDGVTKATSLDFQISGVINPLATVSLMRNGVTVASGTGASILTDVNPPEGSFSYSAQQSLSGAMSGPGPGEPVVVDRTIATPGAPDLEAASDHGPSSTDNITNVNNPTFDTTTNIEAGQTTVQLLRDGTPIVSRTGAGALTQPASADGTYNFAMQQTDLAGNQATSGNLSVTIDTVAPTLSGSAPTWSFQTQQVLTYRFSKSVKQSLTATKMVIKSVTPPAGPIPDASKNFTYNGGSNIATLAFTAQLADGNYNASIAASSVTDTAGNAVATSSLDFFTFRGDANANRTVDVGDLGALATNYGITTGGTWAKGDFNYDQKVDVGDLGALATNYGKTLAAGTADSSSAAPAAAPAAATASSSQSSSSTSLFGDVQIASTQAGEWLWLSDQGTIVARIA
jgi:hypothetical protein